MYESESSIANIFYYVTGTVKRNGIKVYKVVNSRFKREEITEDRLKALCELGVLAGGVKVEHGRVIISKCIEQEEAGSEEEEPLKKEIKQEKEKRKLLKR